MFNIDTFDIVIQLSRKTLLNYILENVTIQNQPIVPTFTLSGGTGGYVNVTLDQVDLSLTVGSDQATLVFHVYAAVVELPGEFPGQTFGFTDGQILVNLQLKPGTPFKAVLESAEFQTSQTSQISDPTSFFSGVNSLFTGMLDTSPMDLFPNTPVATKIRFALATMQVACLDAETVVAVIGEGTLTNVSNFLQFPSVFGLALSAGWVKDNLLFPALITLLDPNDVMSKLGFSTLVEAQDALQHPTPSIISDLKPYLPAPFGTGSIKQSGNGVDIYLDSIDFNLTNGAIVMPVQFHGEGPCVHITNGNFTENITVTIVSQQVLPALSPNPPHTTQSVNFDFWCALGIFLVTYYVTGVVTAAIATVVTAAVATSITVQEQFPSENPYTVPAFDQVIWFRIQIFASGLLLLGESSAGVAFNNTLSGIDIGTTVTPQNPEIVGPGTYHFPGSTVCPAQNFAYTETQQDIQIALIPLPTQLIYPVRTTWSVQGQTVTGSGQISFTGPAQTATPALNGTLLPNHQITVDCKFPFGIIQPKFPSGLTYLTLTIPRSDYNFSLSVQLTVIDASGRTYTRQIWIPIETDVLNFGSDFTAFQRTCGLLGKVMIKLAPLDLPLGGDPLTPVQIVSVVQTLVAQHPSLAIAAVKSLSSTYGVNAVLKAFSPTVGAQGALEQEE